MIIDGEHYGPRQHGTRRDPISAIVGGASSIIGGIFQRKAANDAAKIQTQAAQQAGKGVTDAVASVNPGILKTAADAGANVTGTAATGAAGVNSTANAGATDAANTAAAGAKGVSDAATAANDKLNPYANAGATAADVLNKGIAAGGDFNKTPTMADLQIDPGYAFRQQQAQEALTRSAAAHGAVGGGGFLKDLNREIQGSASQEYQNAFNRFETSTQNRFGNVNAVSNAGQAAAGAQGKNLLDSSEFGAGLQSNASQFGAGLRTNASQFGAGLENNAAQFAGNANINAQDLTASNTIGGARTAGDYLTQGANAAAAGKVAGSNALWGGISGAAAPIAYGASQLFNNPASNYFSTAINPYGAPGAVNPGYNQPAYPGYTQR